VYTGCNFTSLSRDSRHARLDGLCETRPVDEVELLHVRFQVREICPGTHLSFQTRFGSDIAARVLFIGQVNSCHSARSVLQCAWEHPVLLPARLQVLTLFLPIRGLKVGANLGQSWASPRHLACQREMCCARWAPFGLTKTPYRSADGQIEVDALAEGYERWAVEIKWRGKRIGLKEVQRLAHVAQTLSAQPWVISRAGFTPEAESYARQEGIMYSSREDVEALARIAGGGPGTSTSLG